MNCSHRGSTVESIAVAVLSGLENSVDGISLVMPWNVEFTNEFRAWWDTRTERQQEDMAASVQLLMEHGSQLRFPHSSDVEGPRIRLCANCAYRVGADRSAFSMPLIRVGRPSGWLGEKTGDDRFYETFIPVADRLYDESVDERSRKG